MAIGDLRIYKSLGSLIKDYREWRELRQETFAKLIGISVRELQRWETDRRCARIENLHDFSEVTGIPMQVCVALNSDQPVWYSLRKRRFAYSSIEEAHFIKFVSDELYKCPRSDEGILIKNDPITTSKHIRTILSYHRDIYGTEKPLGEDVINKASRILPDLNRIAFDCWGHYVGHQVCLPIRMDVYQQLKKQKAFEGNLTTETMSDIVALREGVFYFYSIFVASTSVAQSIILSARKYLSKIEPKGKYILTRIAVTADGKEISDNLGMKKVFSQKTEYDHMETEIVPTLYEIRLDTLMRRVRGLDALVDMIEEDERKGGAKEDMAGEANRKGLLPSPPQKRDLVSALPRKNVIRKEFSKAPLSVVYPLNVDKKKQVLRVKSPINKIKTEACPNPKCTLYGQTGKDHIISNGTYRTKEGVLSRRFLCKKCGKSFCSRAGSLFYGLRSPEEKILKALNLLIEGMPLRTVAEVLGIKFDTVRRWLEAAAQQSGKIDPLLIKKLHVSKSELDFLWASIKKNSLRQRAVLWKAKRTVIPLQ